MKTIQIKEEDHEIIKLFSVLSKKKNYEIIKYALDKSGIKKRIKDTVDVKIFS